MINTLNKCGLTVHWDTLTNFLESQLEEKRSKVKALTPSDMPLILLMDNVNIFRGNKQHHRLFKVCGDRMWNFTVSGILRPNLDGLEELFSSQEIAVDSQHDIKEFTFDNIELESNPEHLNIWNNHLDCYLSTLLKDGLTLNTEVPLKDMSEKECDQCLATQSYSLTNNARIILILTHPSLPRKPTQLSCH